MWYHAFMKAYLSQLTGGFVWVTAGLLLIGTGCATHEQHSFNSDFNQSLACAPNYYITDGGEKKFVVAVSQGKTSRGQERILDVKRAASAIAEQEAKRRGWGTWDLNYIYEKDEGWMHVVHAEVTRRQTLEYSGDKK